MKECHIAATLSNSVLLTSDNITGLGGDLPHGCISDRVTFGVHYIYWNPNGSAISADPNILEICQDENPPFDGKKFDFLLF